MAKYTINHTCGHTSEAQIYGTNVHGERERQVGWLENRLCADCYRAQQTAQAAKATTSLPALTGSEKQIAWATTIRAQQMKDLAAKVAELTERLAPAKDQYPAQVKRSLDLIARFEATATAQTESRYWIDGRGRNLGLELHDQVTKLGRQMMDEIKAAETVAKPVEPTPAPVAEVAPIEKPEMDDATAEQFASEAWARVEDWYDADDIRYTKDLLVTGRYGSLLGLVGDLIAIKGGPDYGPAGLNKVCAIMAHEHAM